MKTICNKCNHYITVNSLFECDGLFCSNVYCNLCFFNECSLCCMCYQTMLCPICTMIWDICPSCLCNDNVVLDALYCYENFPVDL